MAVNVSDKGYAVTESLSPLGRTPSGDEEVTVLDLLVILAKRKKPIFLSTLAVAITTVIVVFLLPSEYTAETVILPPAQNASASSALLGQLGGSSPLAAMAGAGLGVKSPGDMYVSLFRTRTVEEAVIRRFDLMRRYRVKTAIDARRAFEKRTTVVLGAKDGLIRVGVIDKDPKFAADVANGYVEAFRNLSKDIAITEASQRRVFFEQQLKEANDNLTNAEESMKQTQQSTGMLQIDSQARTLIESAAVLRGQIAAKEVELTAMRSYATEDNPQLVLARQELAGLQVQLAKLAGKDANAHSGIIIPQGNIPQAGMEYLRRLRDVKYYEIIEELIAKQFELAKLDEAKQGALVQVADVAVPPDKRSFPHRTFSVLLMTLIALFVSVLFVLLLATWETMVQRPDKREKLDALRSLLILKR